jgi:hypothetical protein
MKIEQRKTGFAYRQRWGRHKVQSLSAGTKRRFGDPIFKPAKHRDSWSSSGQNLVNFIHLNS